MSVWETGVADYVDSFIGFNVLEKNLPDRHFEFHWEVPLFCRYRMLQGPFTVRQRVCQVCVDPTKVSRRQNTGETVEVHIGSVPANELRVSTVGIHRHRKWLGGSPVKWRTAGRYIDLENG